MPSGPWPLLSARGLGSARSHGRPPEGPLVGFPRRGVIRSPLQGSRNRRERQRRRACDLQRQCGYNNRTIWALGQPWLRPAGARCALCVRGAAAADATAYHGHGG